MPDFGITDPTSVNLDTADPRDIICYINQGSNEYNGNLGARISAIFVIGIISTLGTFFPVVARRVRRLHIPLYVYLFARYFGAGVIVGTAFIHLLDPAYGEIGPQTCVGMTGGWAEYSWCPAIVLTSVMFIFLFDFLAERYVEVKYGVAAETDLEGTMTGNGLQDGEQAVATDPPRRNSQTRNLAAKQDELALEQAYEQKFAAAEDDNYEDEEARKFAVQQQIAAFLILEFGVIFHSVIIGLNLGVSGDEFSTLYPVLVFHQTFEGLGIGARMSTIPFKKGSWTPWLLCTAYGLTTPISIAIGLGVRTTYNNASYTANVVSGVLDSLSAGILIYTGLVELLARDFLFNPLRTRDNTRLAFMVICVFLGTGLMALLGKWA
ncbi:hypothetical protein DV738_g4176, partial [Chaetothyriales sp. CBS 135597]